MADGVGLGGVQVDIALHALQDRVKCSRSRSLLLEAAAEVPVDTAASCEQTPMGGNASGGRPAELKELSNPLTSSTPASRVPRSNDGASCSAAVPCSEVSVATLVVAVTANRGEQSATSNRAEVPCNSEVLCAMSCLQKQLDMHVPHDSEVRTPRAVLTSSLRASSEQPLSPPQARLPEMEARAEVSVGHDDSKAPPRIALSERYRQVLLLHPLKFDCNLLSSVHLQPAPIHGSSGPACSLQRNVGSLHHGC
jgi:hypothetical protein